MEHYLAIAFQRVARNGRGEKNQIVERRQCAFRTEATIFVQSRRCCVLDVIEDAAIVGEALFGQQAFSDFNIPD